MVENMIVNILEITRKKLELSKVKCAKEEMEFKILEREEDINRLRKNIEIQDKRIAEIEKELQGV